jgi:hypothetical protein
MTAHITDIIPRLWWDGKRGSARHDGVTVDLHTAPFFTSKFVIQEIDYAPTLRVSQIRESAQAWRDMTSAERDLALALLTKISTAAHAAADVKESLTAAGVNAAAWSQA